MMSAPAKINLHLTVGAARQDGFHSIASIFQAISLEDSVSLELRDGGGLVLDGECGCPPEKNTAYRAAAAFMAAGGRAGRLAGADRLGLAITITKRIPMGAGLGGGSSDAASTLAGLSALFPGAVSGPEILRIAEGIGSDVPFFMGTACAAVTGRGERLSPLVPRTDYAIVVVNPGFAVSTKEAYQTLDASRISSRQPVRSEAELEGELRSVVRAYGGEPPASWSFKNDFFDALVPGLPGLAECRDSLLAGGALFAAMSGSGSALFGVFGTERTAERAAGALPGRYEPKIAFPLARLRDSI